MNFFKVKTIMIICLLIANILIGFFCMSLYNEKFYVSDEEAHLAENHLASAGVSVSFDRAKCRKYDLPVYASDIDASQELGVLYKKITEEFFGRKMSDTEFVSVPGGFSASIKDNNARTLGTSSFSDGMIIECSLEAFNDDGLSDAMSRNCNYASSFTDNADGSDIRAADKLKEAIFRKTDYDVRFLGTSHLNGGTIVCYGVFLENSAAFDMYINILVNSGKAVRLYAVLEKNAPQKEFSADMADPVDAVYAFADHFADKINRNRDGDTNASVTVNDIGVVYKSNPGRDGRRYYIPSWLISFTDESGRERAAVLDGVALSLAFISE